MYIICASYSHIRGLEPLSITALHHIEVFSSASTRRWRNPNLKAKKGTPLIPPNAHSPPSSEEISGRQLVALQILENPNSHDVREPSHHVKMKGKSANVQSHLSDANLVSQPGVMNVMQTAELPVSSPGPPAFTKAQSC